MISREHEIIAQTHLVCTVPFGYVVSTFQRSPFFRYIHELLATTDCEVHVRLWTRRAWSSLGGGHWNVRETPEYHSAYGMKTEIVLYGSGRSVKDTTGNVWSTIFLLIQ